MRRLSREVPAEEGLGNPVITVSDTTPVQLDVMLESVIDGVLVTGEVRYDVSGECARCLTALAETRSTNLSELYLWQPPEQEDPDAEPLPLVAGGLIDMSEAIRDAIVLDLPLAPLCRDDCPGLCSECGARLADDPDHHHDSTDPRWAALADWQVGDADGDRIGDT